MNNENWDDLRFVLAVAEAGSVNAATKRLGVNHATVLRRVNAFEARHDVRIFVRNASGYTVDPACLPVIEAIREVGHAVDGFDRALLRQGLTLSGPLRLTTTDTLAISVLPRLMPDLLQAFPGLKVQIEVTNTRLDLARLDADLTLRPALALPPDLAGERVCGMGFAAYGRASPSGVPSTASEARWIGVAGNLKNSPIAAWEEGLEPDLIRCTATSFPAMAQLAAQGLGLAMLPCCLGDTSPDLTRVEIGADRLETSIWVACHPDLEAVPRIAQGRRALVAGLRSIAPLLEGRANGQG